ncbi:two-component system sensor histidine kinase BaeS [Tatumella sp. JGM130]|uniref:envelope stress sensor histidine kinase BaeS n=1 Tax=Tatumella sp. JGM130 TaxID=2799797 RepID=UPI001BB0CD20|nr:two-component system sensor histidine kinase BaeS [Tatumella sp. JGM130]MBS0892955.1 two-component system sensor histidine kinase BaeS [Tatumella sp. JGM130]
MKYRWPFTIGSKLFITLFATCLLVLVTMHWAVRISFEHGFVDYIRESNEQRLNLLSEALAEQYEQHGNWDFMRNNNRMIYTLLHSLEQNQQQSNYPQPGWRTPFWIVDSHCRVLLGPREKIPAERVEHPVTTSQGTIVGWVLGSPPEQLTRSTDISFDQQQKRASWSIVGLITLLAAIVAWLLARGLLAPVKRLVNGTHQLAAGQLNTRVEVTTGDELGQLARDFNQLAESLEKTETNRRAFMADISHELRTPLAILQGELEAIQDGVRKLTPEAIQSLQSEVMILKKMVDDLHQLALSDAGALRYQMMDCDLSELLTSLTETFRPRFTAAGLSLECQCPPEVPFHGDINRLNQLCHNLLENSLRYTRSPGSLEIRLTAQENDWLLQFSDSAPGLTTEQQQHIFDRFYRAEDSRNRASGGSGLGLAICRAIAEAHQGSISSQHSLTGGVTIRVILPFTSGGRPL